MFNWLYRRCAKHVQHAGLEKLKEQIRDLELRLEAYKAETHDLIYPTLRKINQREATRKAREEDKEAETATPLNNPMFKY